jgi:hypothetical protein
MGPTLNPSSAMNAYTLSDRATGGQTTRYRPGNRSLIGGAVRLAKKTGRPSVAILARVRAYSEMGPHSESA